MHEGVESPSTFQGHMDQLDETEKYLMQRIEFTESDIEGLAENLRQGTVRVVSDGSFFESTKVATFNVRLESDDKAYNVQTSQYVPGDPDNMDSYRAECTGILAGFIIIATICTYKEVEMGGAKIGCDGASALDMSFKKHWDIWSSESHFNLVRLLIQ